jgi:transcriptional regulator with XRE-family HTH domain
MNAARSLRQARLRSGLSQRDVARRSGVPQPNVSRIEAGAVVPRVDTLDRLLAACGEGLEALPRPGTGIDRTGFRELLRLTPRGRLQRAASEAAALDALAAAVPR